MQVNRLGFAFILPLINGCKSAGELIGDSNIYYDDTVYLSPAPEGQNSPPEPEYTEEDLSQNRNALPTYDLIALEPIDVNRSETALFPQWMNFELETSNPLIGYGLSLFEHAQNVAPDFYDLDTLEYVWGPFPNQYTEREEDKLVLYIRYEAESTFAYQYAVLLQNKDDNASLTPVLWGGTNPDEANPQYGNGVMIVDFSSAEQFSQTYYGESTLTSGRFAVAYSVSAFENLEAGLAVIGTKFSDYLSPSIEKEFNGLNIHGTFYHEERVLNFARFNGESDVHTDEGCSFGCEGSEIESWSFDMVYLDSGQGRG